MCIIFCTSCVCVPVTYSYFGTMNVDEERNCIFLDVNTTEPRIGATGLEIK